MLIDAEELLGQSAFLDAVMEVQPRLSSPADMEGGVDMRTAPGHDLTQLRPVLHLVEFQVLHRCPGDDQAVEILFTDLIEGGVEGGKMVLISMLGLIAGRAQQLYLDLKRGVGELAQDLGLGDDLGGHQIQDQHAQRADVLVHGPVFGHDKDVFAL